jgi:hypothetical protein
VQTDRAIHWPQRAAYYAIALLTAVGAMIFWLLVLEWGAPTWIRPALGLQWLALALALVFTYWRRPPRFFLYPVVLTSVIYLWDTSLPPPSLPEGPLRELVPRLVLIGLVADMLISVRGLQQSPSKRTPIRGGRIQLDGAALVLDTTPDDLRTRLKRIERSTIMSEDGEEYLSLDDLYMVLERWNQRDGRQNGSL